MAKRILIDADVFVALQDSKDNNHHKAVAINSNISGEKIQFILTDPAFGEAITVISQNVGHKSAITFAKNVLNSNTDIVEVDERLRKEALKIFEKQTSKNSRFTDCINMAILMREGLDEIFSFDADYKKNGLKRIGIDTKL